MSKVTLSCCPLAAALVKRNKEKVDQYLKGHFPNTDIDVKLDSSTHQPLFLGDQWGFRIETNLVIDNQVTDYVLGMVVDWECSFVTFAGFRKDDLEFTPEAILLNQKV